VSRAGWCSSRCVGRCRANSGVGDDNLVGLSVVRNIDGHGLSNWGSVAYAIFAVMTLAVIAIAFAETWGRYGSGGR
jgi:hypothetical protein